MNKTDNRSTASPTPNLFIVGAAKAGTTALVDILKQHPDIFISPIKEPNFFNQEIDPKQLHASVSKQVIPDKSYFQKKSKRDIHLALVQDEQDYLSLFETEKAYRYYCDASTGYLYSQKAAQNIFRFNPKAKIIILLRDPVKRSWSHLQMDIARGIQPAENAIEILRSDFERPEKGYLKTHLYIDLSLYYEQIKRFSSCFPSSQILILRQEELASKPAIVLRALTSFLGVDCSFLDASIVVNETRVPRFRWLRRLKSFKRFVPRAAVNWIKRKGLFFKGPEHNSVNEREAKSYISEQVCEDWKKTQKLILDLQKPSN